MNILMIDTSGPACGAALMKDGRIVGDLQLNCGMTHSQRVMPLVDALLSMSGTAMEEIDVFGAVVGPGSFTGVRIGVSTAKALAHAAGKPCIGVDALEALAANIEAFDGVICPILDARAMQVYGAMFEAGNPPVRLMEDEPMKLADFLDDVEKTGRRALFLGDGAPVFEQAIRARLGEKAAFAAPQNHFVRAGSACAAAAARIAQQGEDALCDYVNLLPLYLRAPQAERERAAKEAAKAAQEQKEAQHG
ncbi:MAG: tRNA (adenosine(37)-N6)-threonylcarbamoyltransferase complex dimerization subunit type 1 TsaB [Clostridia bacterium]|nr:tRNA (adenosine(37)-N6)-threonylcarbamoyltransferase complex dimerization subunit type 1 TsaB [Clostridia bacterium]